jgi:hypothetical protein
LQTTKTVKNQSSEEILMVEFEGERESYIIFPHITMVFYAWQDIIEEQNVSIDEHFSLYCAGGFFQKS